MEIIFDFLKDQIIGGAGDILTAMTQASIDLLENEIVQNLLGLFEHIGWIILAIGILFAIANIYIQYLENATLNLHLFILHLMQSFIAMFFLKVGAIEIFNLGNILNGLIVKVTASPDYEQSIDVISDYLLTITNINAIWFLLVGLVCIGSIIVCLIQIMKRGGLYVGQIMIGYIYLFSLPSGNTDEFTEWCKQTIAIALTNVLQTGLLFTGINIMAKDGASVLLGIGVIMGACSIEKIAGRYGLSTNVSGSIGKNVKGAGQTIGRLVFKG